MKSTNLNARIVGILILVQLVDAFLVNFVLLRPLSAGFLEIAAESSLQVTIGALLYGGLGALAVAIAIAVRPVFRKYSSSLTLWFLSLSIVSFSLFAVECATLMSMLSLSQNYAAAAAADAEVYNALGEVVRSARIWAHFTNVLVGSFMMLVFYVILYRYILIPLALSAFGLVGAVLHIIATALPFFGLASLVLLFIALPLALSQLIVGLLLITKGFYEQPHLFRSNV